MLPVDDVFDVLFGNVVAITVSDGTLEECFDGYGKGCDSRVIEFVEIVEGIFLVIDINVREAVLVGVGCGLHINV